MKAALSVFFLLFASTVFAQGLDLTLPYQEVTVQHDYFNEYGGLDLAPGNVVIYEPFLPDVWYVPSVGANQGLDLAGQYADSTMTSPILDLALR